MHGTVHSCLIVHISHVQYDVCLSSLFLDYTLELANLFSNNSC